MIYIGDGVIPQIERYAYVISFDTFLTAHMKEAIKFMISKTDNLTGNDFVVICNSLLWAQINDNLMNEIAKWQPTACLMYSKVSGIKKNVGESIEGVKVGNTFTSYEYAGKVVLLAA